MARAIKQGQHIFIAFQDGEAVLDSQLRPRMYKSREQFEKSFPAWRDGKAELVEYAPTLTPPNEPLTLEQLREMDGEPVWVKCLKPSQYTDPPERWRILEKSITGHFGVWNGDCALIERNYGTDWLAYRRPPEGEEEP